MGGNWKDWEIRDFTEGYVDKLENSLLPDNASPDCQNAISRVVGELEGRGGQLSLNSSSLVVTSSNPILGLYPYYTSAGLRRLVVSAEGKVYYWNTDTFTQLHSGLNTSADVMFESCANYMVGFNGVSTPFKWSGTGAASTLANAPATGRYPILYKEKLFIALSDEPSQVWWSDEFDPESWPAINYWSFKEGDGDQITNLMSYFGELMVFKRKSTHTLKGTTLDDFSSMEVHGSIGCVGPRAAALDGVSIYFVGDMGLYKFNGARIDNIGLDRIPVKWESVNKQYLHKAVVQVWNGMIWFMLPYDDSTSNNLVLAYDSQGGKFWPWVGINLSCSCTFFDGVSTKLYGGSTTGGWVIQQDIGTDDMGTPINSYYITKAFNQGTPDREKRAKKAFVESEKIQNHFTATGSANAYAVTLSPAIGAYTDRLSVWFRANFSNTGACTLNCNSVGAVAIKIGSSGLSSGAILQNDLVHVIYDSTTSTFQYQTPVTLSIALDFEETFTDMVKVKDNGIIREYKFPTSKRGKWRYLSAKFSHNALGAWKIRGLMIPCKVKPKPRVRNT